jgi:hypothetical protein
LHFLPAESKASLAHSGDIVDAKMSRLMSDSDLETARFRQAVYVNFIKQKQIPDPCGNEPGYERIIACFIKQLMIDQIPCSSTVGGYVKAIHTLF